MKYRREIDGLRAIAVLTVIFFHAGFKGFGGGFVGVDIFFVISGFLITTIILAAMQAGTFSLAEFYERRMRRLLPALFLTVVACLPFAWLWLLPQELKRFSQSVAAAAVFASNILFWRTTDYFDVQSSLKPLIHTWSLAVEEQYYLFFPVIFMAIFRFGKRYLSIWLVAGGILSLLAAQWGAAEKPLATFYLLPTRGWEFLIGSFAALYFSSARTAQPSAPVNEIGGFAGLCLIAYSVVAFDLSTPFPSFYTLVPTVGAALVILFASPRTVAGRLLGSKPLVGIGLISYSAYLLHQPIFAFARSRSLGELDTAALGLLAVLSLVLAYPSWKYVEQPFRRKHTVSRRQIFLGSAVGTMCVFAIGVSGYLADGFRSRLPPNITWQSLGDKLETEGRTCVPSPVSGYEGVLSCPFGDKLASRNVFLYGDSHAQAIMSELDRALRAAHIKGVRITMQGCGPIPKIYDARIAGKPLDCDGRFQRLLDYVKSAKGDVVVVSRWSFRLFPIPGQIDDMPYRNSEGGVERDAAYQEQVSLINGDISFDAPGKAAALELLIKSLLSTGGRVLLVYPIPEIGWDIARLNLDHFRKTGSPLSEISIPYSDFIRRNRFVDGVFDKFGSESNLIAIKPSEIFCNTIIKDRCAAQYNTVPFYYDDDHVSDDGARLIVGKVMNALAQSVIKARH